MKQSLQKNAFSLPPDLKRLLASFLFSVRALSDMFNCLFTSYKRKKNPMRFWEGKSLCVLESFYEVRLALRCEFDVSFYDDRTGVCFFLEFGPYSLFQHKIFFPLRVNNLEFTISDNVIVQTFEIKGIKGIVFGKGQRVYSFVFFQFQTQFFAKAFTPYRPSPAKGAHRAKRCANNDSGALKAQGDASGRERA